LIAATKAKESSAYFPTSAGSYAVMPSYRASVPGEALKQQRENFPKSTALIEEYVCQRSLRQFHNNNVHSKYNGKLFSKILYERTDLTGRPKIGCSGFGTPNPKLGTCRSCL
jgi:hypothetical protein